MLPKVGVDEETVSLLVVRERTFVSVSGMSRLSSALACMYIEWSTVCTRSNSPIVATVFKLHGLTALSTISLQTMTVIKHQVQQNTQKARSISIN